MGEILDAIDRYGVIIRRRKLEGVRGMACKTKDGYVILIDDRISDACYLKTVCHEMQHILLGHLDERVDIEDDQKEAEVRTALKAMGY